MEQRRCEREQVKALRLIFKLAQRDSELFREFVQCDGYAMIVKVCMTDCCIVGHEIIKVRSFAGSVHILLYFILTVIVSAYLT